ncbi:holin [Gordonia sp. (in: high G+C Gram-positive bacteria)]|uniref:holin n=1 Tax=Gordonia sp. (in: high G+C Gram-positive bacteria) TaxID=84139 RepID=UPI00261F54E5|nr:holin [Gordonia sp. (in: high G+C Gram-positive bacteria)]
MWTKRFWQDLADRAVRTFAQALLGVFVAGQTVMTISWPAVLATAGTAAAVSVITSIALPGPVGGRDPESSYIGEHRRDDPE